MVKESATLTPKVLQSGGILKPKSCDSLGNQDQVYQPASTLYEIPYGYQEASYRSLIVTVIPPTASGSWTALPNQTNQLNTEPTYKF